MILAVGKVLFYGSLDTALPYFTHIGFPVPLFMNPADHFLDVSTMDTSTPRNRELSEARIGGLTNLWRSQFDAIAFPPYNSPPEIARYKSGQSVGKHDSSLKKALLSHADSVADLTKANGGITEIAIEEMSSGRWIKGWSILVRRQCLVYFRDWALVVMGPVANAISVL